MVKYHYTAPLLLLSISASSSFPHHAVEAAAIIQPRQQFSSSVNNGGGTGNGAASTTVVNVPATTSTVFVSRSSSLSSSSANFFGATTSSTGTAPSSTSSSSPISSSSSNLTQDTPMPILAPGQNITSPNAWILYNADAVHYPFTVHVPDRVTRKLPPLTGPLPLVLSLSGSGGRGTAAQAKQLSGYDGTSRFVRQYYEGNRSIAHTIAAEELLVVTPICPEESSQANAAWDINIFPNILAQVIAAYDVDLTRVYLTTYSMGARAGWPLLMENPDIFAASVISSGATFAQPYQLQALLGNTIRNYYGANDENGLSNATLNTQANYEEALQQGLQRNPNMTNIYNTRQLETIGPIPNANHLNMNESPWQEQVDTDGYAGLLSWLVEQTKPEGANIPAYNATICTTCIPAGGGLTGH